MSNNVKSLEALNKATTTNTLSTAISIDDIVDEGKYTGEHLVITGFPGSRTKFVLHVQVGHNDNSWVHQQVVSMDGIYIRRSTNTGATWEPWATVWTSATGGSGSGMDSDLLDGFHETSFVRTDKIGNTPDLTLAGLDESVVATAISVNIYNINNDDDGGTAAKTAGLNTQYVLIAESTQILIYDSFDSKFPLVHTISGLSGVTCMGVVNGEILVGTTTGLHIYDMLNNYLEGTPATITNNNVADIKGLPDGSMSVTWAVANAGGLSMIQPNNSVVELVNGVAQVAVHVDAGLKSADSTNTVNIWDVLPTSVVVPDHTATAIGAVNTITGNYVGCATGLTILDEDREILHNVTTTDNSGYLLGDNKGAWLGNNTAGSVVTSDPDNSHNGVALPVVGTVTKSAVYTGSDTMKYGGFAAGNYFSQAYRAALDFGTGDFHIMVWVDPTAALADGSMILNRGRNSGAVYGTGPAFVLVETSDGDLALGLWNGFSSQFAQTTATAPTDTPYFVSCGRRSGNIYISIDAGAEDQTACVYDLDNDMATLNVGSGAHSAIQYPLTNANLSLLRIGAGAPTVAQVQNIYEKELKLLWTPNNSGLLGGANNDIVTSEENNGITHIASSTTVTEFAGDRNINTTTEVVTSMAFDGDLVIKGN